MSLWDVWAASTPGDATAREARREFLDGRVVLHVGDSLDILDGMEACSVDSIVSDPPYHLTSVVKRFGADGAASAKFGTDGLYARQSRGFMGKTWDGGDVAFRPEFWAKVWRVLKPGGHLVAFSGTRTYHRMVCAIEDAGFEVRDQLAWVYGSGFPKSLDVSKAIDRQSKSIEMFETIREHIRKWRDSAGLSNDQLNTLVGSSNSGCGMARHWTSEKGGQHTIPSKEQWQKLKIGLKWPSCELDVIYDEVKDGVERPAVGQYEKPAAAVLWRVNYGFGEGGDGIKHKTISVTEAAKQWEGWGTALKPAHEPIVLARKPLIGTVVENMLEHGTGGLNVGACRIATSENLNGGAYSEESVKDRSGSLAGGVLGATGRDYAQPNGRWPANLLHDGSPEVLAGFPETRARGNITPTKSGVGMWHGEDAEQATFGGDSGSAARFFYCAKASKKDRVGSRHPTVKPVALMRWLCRLVTPLGGTCLDPFAGSGTTGQAAYEEGFRAILCEREADYAADIAERMRRLTER